MKRQHITVITLLVSILAGACTETMATSTLNVHVEMTNGTIYENQRVEFTAVVTRGAPPYTYQWYSIFIPKDVLEHGYPYPPSLVKVKIPDANSSKLEFTQSEGTYNVNLEVWDSTGNDILVSSPNFVTVLTPTSTPTLPTSFPTSNPTVPEFPLLVVLPLFLSMLTIAIILKLRKQRMPQNML